MLRKALLSFAAIVAVLSMALPTNAATNLNWTDLSSQLTSRTNRPVWAMTYANGNWFYTDGQDLWNGGQVYRYDGYTQTNITTDVRNAGISRVDDIVTDGQSVLFLKDITAKNNSFQVLSYNGSYADRTSYIRSPLISNEGIASIVGKNGSWMIVTTNGRVFAWDGSYTAPISVFSGTSAYTYDIGYSTRHVSPSDNNAYLPVSVVPTSYGWLIAMRDSNGYTRFWNRTTSGSLTDVTTTFGSVSQVLFAASNGSSAILALNTNASTAASRIVSYDGYTLRDLTSTFNVVPTTSWYRMISAWDGTEWALIGWNKSVYTFDGTNALSLGATRDYFVTVAGSNNQTFLAGGAESNDGSLNPNFPLTAKLAKMTESSTNNANSNNTSFGGGQSVTSGNGPTLTTSGNPSDFRVGNGGTFNYRATASDANGVDRIDLYINNARIKTCYDTVCEFSTSYFTNGQTSRTVSMSARATDKLGYSTDLPRLDYLTVDQSNATAGNTSNTSNNNNSQTTGNLSVWSWLDPNQTSIANNGTATFNIGAWGSNGLSRIDIVVNGTTRRTCNYSTAYGNQTCSYTVYGGDYNVGTSASMNAMITGADGKTAWSPLTNVYITNTNGSTNNPNPSNTNANTSVWVWSSPEASNIATNASAQFSVGASDVDGISKIEMYVNGSIANTCNLGTAYGTQGCNVTVNGSSYSVGSDIFVNAKVTDVYGNTTWTGSRTYRIVASTTTPSTSANQTANWIWSTPDVSSLTTGQSATFNIGAWDADGLNRTEIWVNGQLKQTCNFNNVVGNRDCSFVIDANSYPVGTSVFVNAMMIDAKGNTTWSASRSYAITSSTYNQTTPTSPTNLPGWLSVTSNRDAGYTNNQLITYTVTANDQNGIDRLELWVNGSLVKTCYNTSTCSWTGGSYNNRNYVNYGASVVDKAGYALWTGYKTIAKK